MPGFDHREICRHENLSDPGLQLILGALREGMAGVLSSATISQVANNTPNDIPKAHLESGPDDTPKLGN
jgi:hypothetical protein